MNERQNLPIGVFDSGLGGLTIIRALRQVLPNESFIYFGDTAHLPYGEKSASLIQAYSAAITRFLCQQKVKAIVIACNTASAVALEKVRENAGEIPVFDVVNPAADYAISISPSQKIGLMATKTTVHSHIYKTLLSQRNPQAQIVEKATPLLVPMIEEGWLQNAISQQVIDAYLSDTGFENIDTLILGCTHYPLIKKEIQAYFDKNNRTDMHIVDSSFAVANYVKASLSTENLLLEAPSNLPHQFFLSDFTQNFEDSARLFLGENVTFEKVVLED